MNKKKLALAGIGIFLAGLLTGGLGTGAYIKHRLSPMYRMEKVGASRFFMERLDHALDLSDEQRKSIEPIVEEVIGKIHEVRGPFIKAEEAILDDGAKRIGTYLNEDQKARFQKFLERARRLKGRVFGPLPPGGMPPPPPPPNQ